MKTSSRFNLLSLIAAALATIFTLANAERVRATTLIVTTTADIGGGSLRDMIAAANNGDTIEFDAGLTGQTITLTSGQLTIDKNITISGPGADVLTVERGGGQSPPFFRIFWIKPGHTVTVEGITISNGLVETSGGGGIHNDHSTLTVRSCALSGNSAVGGIGGGISNDGQGDGTGGSATLMVVNSTLSGNSANYAGGIANWGPYSAGSATLTVVNSTLSGNSGTIGAIYNEDTQGGSATLTVANSTLSGNSDPQPQIFNRGALTLGNTILKTLSPGYNITIAGGPVTSNGYNLSSDSSAGFLTAPGDQINTDPILGPLQDNGGPTFTHAPFSTSPAIDKGKDIGATGATGRDQRGNVRPVTFDVSIPAGGDRSDIGAVELPAQGIYGTISYCSNPVPGPVPNVTLTVTGDATTSTMTEGTGNYQFLSLAAGGNYTVTPTKAALTPGSAGINGVDVIAVQKHFLGITLLPVGCRRDAADVNGGGVINGVDVIAIQKFFLGLTSGTFNVGKYKFTPANRTYTGLVSNQTAQNYDALVFGDVASGFIHRPGGPSQTAADDGTSAGEVPSTVAAVVLPEVAVDAFVTDFIVQVTTTTINAKNKLVGFQGDFTFDERVVAFQSEPVQKAGITSSNWNVSGNVLPGSGPD